MGDYDDEDNSDQYMAESMKEAEAEVKANKGKMPDLSSKISKLYAESNPTKPPNEEPILSEKERHEMAVNSEEMAADALSTTSKLSFDGAEVEVKNTSNGANSEENKALTKAATHQALLDVNKELGIKTEEKKEKKVEEPKKAAEKKAEPKQNLSQAKKEEPKKESAKPAEVKKEEPKLKVAEVKKEEPKKVSQPKLDLAQKHPKKEGHKKHKKKHHHKKHKHHKEEDDEAKEEKEVEKEAEKKEEVVKEADAALSQKKKAKKSKKNKHTLLQGGDDIDSDDIFGAQESEDKEIMKSIAYAESKLGAKMGTPKKVETQKNSPVKYDVEDVAQIKSEQLGSMASETGQDLGDCDFKDEECIAQQHKVLAEAAKQVDPKKTAVKKVEVVQANSTA